MILTLTLLLTFVKQKLKYYTCLMSIDVLISRSVHARLQRYINITRDLHWLPIRQRIVYKLSSIVYKCLYGAAPSYLMNLCIPVATNTGRRYLCSATHGDLLVPRTRTVTYRLRTFAVSSPTIWNMLP